MTDLEVTDLILVKINFLFPADGQINQNILFHTSMPTIVEEVNIINVEKIVFF